MPRRWCAACAFVRSFAYSECPLAGETEREKKQMEGWQRQAGWGDRNSENRKRRKNRTEWLGEIESKNEKSREKNQKSVSSGCRSASLAGTVWRTMLLLVECDVCPLSNSTHPRRKHTYNQVSIMHLTPNNLSQTNRNTLYSNIKYSLCVKKIKKTYCEKKGTEINIQMRWSSVCASHTRPNKRSLHSFFKKKFVYLVHTSTTYCKYVISSLQCI